MDICDGRGMKDVLVFNPLLLPVLDFWVLQGVEMVAESKTLWSNASLGLRTVENLMSEKQSAEEWRLTPRTRPLALLLADHVFAGNVHPEVVFLDQDKKLPDH
jgi:hypothetical protein